jgi:hypothetical protein
MEIIGNLSYRRPIVTAVSIIPRRILNYVERINPLSSFREAFQFLKTFT